jgi:hypothetical protein
MTPTGPPVNGSVTADDGGPGQAPPAAGTRRFLQVAVVVLGLAALTTLLYFVADRSFLPDSDGATVVLEGQSMAAGHLTLHGWALSVDSFWSVDAVFYTVGVLFVGVREALLYVTPALIASLVVLMGVLIAREGRKTAAAIASGLTVVALLGLPSHYLAAYLLRGPLHVGTTLWCLVAFFLLRRGRFGAGWAVAVLFLAAGLLGDLQMVGLGLLPVFGAGIAAMLRTRRVGAGTPLVGAALASVVVALVVRELAKLVGTFTIGKVQKSASSAQMVKNVKDIVPAGLHMLGLGGGTGGVPQALEDVHLVGVLVVVAALVYYAVKLIAAMVAGSTRAPAEVGTTETWRLDDLVLFGCIGGVVAFVALSSSSASAYDRYLTSAIIFACILAARMVGAWVSAPPSVALWRWSSALGLVCVVAFVGADAHVIQAGDTLSGPARPAAELGRFLEAHGLHHGLGDYWSASIVTVTTDDDVAIRPVTVDPAGRVVRYGRQSSAAWYTGKSFQFLVYNTAISEGVDSPLAAATFGAVEHTYRVGPYRVLVWPHPISVSAAGYDPG